MVLLLGLAAKDTEGIVGMLGFEPQRGHDDDVGTYRVSIGDELYKSVSLGKASRIQYVNHGILSTPT